MALSSRFDAGNDSELSAYFQPDCGTSFRTKCSDGRNVTPNVSCEKGPRQNQESAMARLPLSQSSALALAMAATLTAAVPAGAGEKAIKIGVLADMNGPLSTASGPGSLEAARLAAQEFGWSIGGKRIQIISADHQNKPDIGAAIARQWFDVEHVDVVADLSNSAVGFAVVEVAKPLNKIVLVSGPGSSDFSGKACAPTSIHWTWDTYAAATATARAIVGPDANTWFFITSDFAFGRALEHDGARAVEKLGGAVVGQVRAPFNNPDFSSYLLQAQQSKASVVALATAGQDTVNLVKQAAEFNLPKFGTRIAPMQMMLDEIKAIGLELGKGTYATIAFHHERSVESRKWAERFFERMHAMPTQIHAGTYSAVRHYLQAVTDLSSDDPLLVVAKMRATPVNDIFATGGYIREDGRMVHDMYLVQIKTPAESKDPWDLVKVIKTIRGDDAFRPLAESDCPLVKKKS
jgi:branched-chain amino acid transport system substrate-binding protein